MLEPAAEPAAAETKEDADDEGADDAGPKVLSKKEKEKLKKEREKVSLVYQSTCPSLTVFRLRKRLKPLLRKELRAKRQKRRTHQHLHLL